MSRRPWIKTLLLAAIFVASFFMRAYHPVSRPDQWYVRGNAFVHAIQEQDWASTYQQYHPGVTTMAIAGYTMSLYDEVRDTPAAALFEWTSAPFTTSYGTRTAIGIMGLALAFAVLILLTTLVLEKLAGTAVGLTAGGLLTFSPFFLTQSRVLHVDALVSILMLLSASLMLLYAQTRRWRHVVLSGLAGGFAFLTKSPSVFLVPFLGLTLLVYYVLDLVSGWADHPSDRWRWLLGRLWRLALLPGLLWLVTAVLPFGLWPAMWVAPGETVGQLFTWVGTHAQEAHPVPRFFAGEVLRPNYHPGFGFYPISLALNETFVTISLSLLALALYLFWRRRAEPRLAPSAFWLLIGYVFFFVLQMSITAKQDERYIVPAHLMMNVIAAVGVVAVGDLLVKAAGTLKRPWTTYLASAAVAFQALLALMFMPDTGGHHNYLFGGNPVAARLIHVTVQNEGIEAISAYLDQQPNPESIRVSAYSAQDLIKSLDQYFVGFSTRTVDTEGVDYMIFMLQNFQRRVGERFWQPAWDELQARGLDPAVVVSYDGVEHMWLMPTQPTGQPTVVVNRGWIGMVGVAWLWTLALIGGTAWALRRIPRPAEAVDWELTPVAWRGFALWMLPGAILLVLKFFPLSGSLGWFLSLDQQLSLAVFLLSALLTGLAVLAGWRGLSARGPARWGWWLLAASLLVLGLDEFYAYSDLLPVQALFVIWLALSAALAVAGWAIWFGASAENRPSPVVLVGLIGLLVVVVLEASGAYVCRDPTLDRPCRDLALTGQVLEWLVLGVLLLAMLARRVLGSLRTRVWAGAGGVAGLWIVWMLLSLLVVPGIEARRAWPAALAYANGDLELIAYKLDRAVLEPGEAVTMTVYWRKSASDMRPYRMSMHWLRRPDLESVAQADPFIAAQVGGGDVDLPDWPAGLIARQRITVELPPDLPTPHAYQAMFRVWDLSDNSDLPIVQTDLQTLGPGTVILTSLPAVTQQAAQIPPGAEASYQFADDFTLVGYQLPASIPAGGAGDLEFWWRSDSATDVDLTQMVHFFQNGEFVVALDAPPFGGEYPTSVWVPGTTVHSIRQIQLPAELTPGEYQLYTGMYSYPALERWPVVDGSGQPVLNNAIYLGDITVIP